MNKSNIFVEITLTNNCNCNCSYCFEGKHLIENRKLDIEQRQLQLIIDACKNFDITKYDKFIISFWGGEPFLNTEFMYQLINATKQFEFVVYHCYSNGTLTKQYKDFVNQPFINEIKNRLHIQLSYDGEPHNNKKRGYTFDCISEATQLLIDNGIQFTFKATLSFDMIPYLTEIWKSYKTLFLRFKNYHISYVPTLDTSISTIEYFDEWKKQLQQIAKLEYLHIKEYGMPLWKWFNNMHKSNCLLGNSIHMHNDGNIYICHGCPYSKIKNNSIIANINNISSLYDIITDKYNLSYLPEKCIKCSATYCSVCHITQISENDNVYNNWVKNRCLNDIRCSYFKYFGYISNLLKLLCKSKYN